MITLISLDNRRQLELRKPMIARWEDKHDAISCVCSCSNPTQVWHPDLNLWISLVVTFREVNPLARAPRPSLHNGLAAMPIHRSDFAALLKDAVTEKTNEYEISDDEWDPLYEDLDAVLEANAASATSPLNDSATSKSANPPYQIPEQTSIAASKYEPLQKSQSTPEVTAASTGQLDQVGHSTTTKTQYSALVPTETNQYAHGIKQAADSPRAPLVAGDNRPPLDLPLSSTTEPRSADCHAHGDTGVPVTHHLHLDKTQSQGCVRHDRDFSNSMVIPGASTKLSLPDREDGIQPVHDQNQSTSAGSLQGNKAEPEYADWDEGLPLNDRHESGNTTDGRKSEGSDEVPSNATNNGCSKSNDGISPGREPSLSTNREYSDWDEGLPLSTEDLYSTASTTRWRPALSATHTLPVRNDLPCKKTTQLPVGHDKKSSNLIHLD